MDAGAIPEHLAEADIPDLLQILVDFSITPETQTEFLSIFERLGGLRIWLPLIATLNARVRRITLRLLRTYIIIKCNSFPTLPKVVLLLNTSILVVLLHSELLPRLNFAKARNLTHFLNVDDFLTNRKPGIQTFVLILR